MAKKRRSWPELTQPHIAFAIGISGFLYEVFVHPGEPRSVLVLAELAMMGVPATLWADDLVRRRRDADRTIIEEVDPDDDDRDERPRHSPSPEK